MLATPLLDFTTATAAETGVVIDLRGKTLPLFALVKHVWLICPATRPKSKFERCKFDPMIFLATLAGAAVGS
jgi:hypothetical protein